MSDIAIEILTRQVEGAVTLFFEQRDPVWVQALASIARSQIEPLAKAIKDAPQKGMFISEMAQQGEPTRPRKDILDELNMARSLMTHLTNPDNFKPEVMPDTIDMNRLLGLLTSDYMTLCQRVGKILPSSILAFCTWHMARDEGFGDEGKRLEKRFPIFRDLKKIPLNEQIERGRKFQQWFVTLTLEERAQCLRRDNTSRR